jgi:hypothetical protein
MTDLTLDRKTAQKYCLLLDAHRKQTGKEPTAAERTAAYFESKKKEPERDDPIHT